MASNIPEIGMTPYSGNTIYSMPLLHRLLSYVPPPGSSKLPRTPLGCPCCSPEQHFADTHIGDACNLRRVVVIPEISSYLAEVSSEMQELIETDHRRGKLHATASVEGSCTKGPVGVSILGNAYYQQCGVAALALAGGSLLGQATLEFQNMERVSAKPWNSFMRCGVPTDTDIYGRQTLDFRKEEQLSLDERARFHDLAEHCPVWLQWQLFFPTVESDRIIRDLTDCARFPWATLRFADKSPDSQPITARKPDAPEAPWTTTWIANKDIPDIENPWPTRQIGSEDEACSGRKHCLDPYHYVQRMWTQAVEWDTTFMVFHNACSERIGIRNRKTQTLFLSDVIAVGDSKYTRIHHGLHVAAIQDALQRVAILRWTPDHIHALHPGPSRISCLHPAGDSLDSVLSRKITPDPKQYSPYTVLLLRLQYDGFHSPHPLVFHRLRSSLSSVEDATDTVTEVDEPSKSITLTLRGELGEGVFGTVQSAVLSCNGFPDVAVLVQFSFSIVEGKSLIYGGEVHDRRASQNDPSRPKFYGTFQDTLSWMTLLILEKGKHTFRRQFQGPDRFED